MKIHVVICQYEGCDECSSGAHIVGAFFQKEDAKKAEYDHDHDKNAHRHIHCTEEIEVR